MDTQLRLKTQVSLDPKGSAPIPTAYSFGHKDAQEFLHFYIMNLDLSFVKLLRETFSQGKSQLAFL